MPATACRHRYWTTPTLARSASRPGCPPGARRWQNSERFMSTEILFVDDDPVILAAFQRSLRKDFKVDTAEGGAAALALIHSRSPYAVVVADMRMPGMNGVEFLVELERASPDTVRMMLT